MMSQVLKRDLPSYAAPEGLLLRAPNVGEVRLLDTGPHRDVAVFYNEETMTTTPLVPDGLEDVDLCTFLLDQGSIGAAGQGFLILMMNMSLLVFDKLHRCIRDMKLSLEKAAGGVIQKAHVYSTYLWSVRRKPFKSGGNSTTRERMLDVFLARNGPDSPIITKYIDRLSDEFGIPAHDREAIYHRISELRTFRRREEEAKAGRWFSWNASADAYMDEFTATKLVYEDSLPNVSDPDYSNVPFGDLEAATKKRTPQSIINSLRQQNGGGQQLSYMLMHCELLVCVKIIFVVTQVLWDWFTYQTTQIKTPEDTVMYNIYMAWNWASDSYVLRTLKQSMYNGEKLNSIGIKPPSAVQCPASEKYVYWLSDFTIKVVANRFASLASKHSVPPDSLSPLLGNDPIEQQRVAVNMQRDWLNYIALEDLRHSDKRAMELHRDITFMQNPVIRTIFLFFERDQFSVASGPGLRTLRGTQELFPCQKMVEELHHDIRIESRTQATSKITSARMQRTVIRSKKLESRGIPHPARVTKDEFIRNWGRKKKYVRNRKKHWSWTHKLPKKWARIMGKKIWNTTSEQTARVAAAAWAWLREYRLAEALPGQLPLGSALYSGLFRHKFLCLDRAGEGFLVLESYKWAVLTFPVERITVGDVDFNATALVRHRLRLDGHAKVSWTFVTSHKGYTVLPYRFVRGHCGIVLDSLGPAEPVLKASLREAPQLLGHSLLFMLAQALEIEGVQEGWSRARLLRALCVHVGDESFAEMVEEKDISPPAKEAELLADDPLFECAFADFDDDNKAEFREISNAMKRRRLSRHLPKKRPTSESTTGSVSFAPSNLNSSLFEPTPGK